MYLYNFHSDVIMTSVQNTDHPKQLVLNFPLGQLMGMRNSVPYTTTQIIAVIPIMITAPAS